MKEKLIKAVGDMKSVSYASYHQNLKGYEQEVKAGTPLFVHNETESRKGIVVVDFELFLLLVHIYLNYVSERQKQSDRIPTIFS